MLWYGLAATQISLKYPEICFSRKCTQISNIKKICGISWPGPINDDEYLLLTILGVPLGAPEALSPFSSKLADRIDEKVSKLAPATNYMTIFGSTSVVNHIIYGIPRYWL